jgi:hypothetical protein
MLQKSYGGELRIRGWSLAIFGQRYVVEVYFKESYRIYTQEIA